MVWRLERRPVFPAHAGMSPVDYIVAPYGNSFPRSRGDEPLRLSICKRILRFSPLTRG